MSIGHILKETWNGYDKHRIGDLAAMLTYYAIFALFPFCLFLVTLTLLVLPRDVLDQAFRIVAFALPGSVSVFALDQLHRLESSAGGGFAVVGIGLAVWSASRGAAALQTALNEIHEVKETRAYWKAQAIAIGTTLFVSVLLLVALALLVFGPVVGHFLMDRFGLGSVFDFLYSFGRWLGAALVVMLVWACLYYFLPNIKRRFRWVTPGAVVGTALWLCASRGFMFYTDNFGSYDKTYGTLGGVIVFLTWLWLSCLAFLVGGEIDDAIDEIRKQREGATGEVPIRHREGTAPFPITPDVGRMRLQTSDKETAVERDTRMTRELALTDLAKRVGDDLSTLAKDHFELARIELATGAKKAVVDGAAVLLGGVVALIGLAMLCVTLVVAAEPILAPLWLRLFLGALVYLAIGGSLCYGFIRRLRGEPLGLERSRHEVRRTVQALREQVHNG